MTKKSKDERRVLWMFSGLIVLLLVMTGVILWADSARAGGSDSETPYTVTAEGITLPAGYVFEDNGHINVQTNQGNRGIHFESLNNQPSGVWIGESFLPWSAFGFDKDTLCVSWVQLSQFNEHFGEGGQSPVGYGCTVTPSPTPTVTETESPSPAPTVTETTTPSPSPSETETSTPSPEPSETVTPTPSPTESEVVEPTPGVSETPGVTVPATSELAKTGTDGVWVGILVWAVFGFVAGWIIYSVAHRRN